MSLRIVPTASHATSTTNTQSSKLTPSSSQHIERGAPSAPGLHDTLRSSLTTQPISQTAAISSTHPLEARLTQWTQTQQTLKHNLLKRTYGIAEPIRRGMELSIVQAGDFRPSVLGTHSSVHEDILSGRDSEISWEDIYAGQDGLVGGTVSGGDGAGVGVLEEMERRVGMGKW